MRLCPMFWKKPDKVREQLEISNKLLDDAEAQIDKLQATLDGESRWFLTLEKVDGPKVGKAKIGDHLCSTI